VGGPKRDLAPNITEMAHAAQGQALFSVNDGVVMILSRVVDS
jgi:hypothetical protein